MGSSYDEFMEEAPPEEGTAKPSGYDEFMDAKPLEVTNEGVVPTTDATPANGDKAEQAKTLEAPPEPDHWAKRLLDNDTSLSLGAGLGQGVLDRYVGEPLGNALANVFEGSRPEGTVRVGGGAIDQLPKSGFFSARTLGKLGTGIPAAILSGGSSLGAQAGLGAGLGVTNAVSEGEDPIMAGLLGAGGGALGKLGAMPGQALRRLTKPATQAVAEVGDWAGQAARGAVDAPWLQAPARKLAQLGSEVADPIMRGAEQFRSYADDAAAGVKDTVVDAFGLGGGRGARAVAPIELPAAQAGGEIVSGAAQYGVPAAAAKSPIEKLLEYAGKSRADLMGEAAKVAPGIINRAADTVSKFGAGLVGGTAAPIGSAFADPAKAKAQDKAYAGTPTTSWAVQSVLSSGTHGLPEDAAQQLTEAAMSGDPQQIVGANFRLSQRYPAYAKRMEDEYKALQEGGE